MRTARCLVLLVLLALPASVLAGRDGRHGRPADVPCPEDVAAALEALCPCDEAMSHGRYVSCVARARNALRRAGCLSDDARALLRCAARSTCGRSAAVVCCPPAGAPCDGDDCRSRPRISRDGARCAAAGGVPGGTGSVCGACMPTTTSSSSSTSSSSTSTSTSTTTSTSVPAGVVYGNAAEFPTASINSPGYLLGGPVTVPVASTLTHLGVIGKQAGPNAMIALYSSDSQGRPHRLLAATPAVPLEVGPMEVAVTPRALAAGTYWLVGTFDAEASIGIDETDPMAPVRYVNQQFSAGLPDPFGAAFAYSGQRFNYYVRVE